ncbi:phosphoglycerate dehydrogenase [Cytophagales bacterium RKSG123]|nr:phosphoglycerate dehydrogenase [Xanthovirga aplysinae]
MHSSIVPLLEEVGLEVSYQPKIKRSELIAQIEDYDGLIVRSKTNIDKEVLAQAGKLKFIGRAGAGVDKIDLQEVKRLGVQLINAPEGNRDAVAEHAMGMLLGLLNNMYQANEQVKSGIWDREGNRGIELKGKTVGVVGYGYMGRAFARRLSAFGCEVMAYDRYKSNYGDEYGREVSLEELHDKADIVSFHFPLTEENRFSIDTAYLNSFKKPIFLINTARGEILRLEDLISSLKSGKVIGAALDVLENEKFHKLSPAQKQALDWLAKSNRVLFTPHVAGWTHESYYKLNKTLADKIRALKLFADEK